MHNSVTKNVGDRAGERIENKIDDADLRRSHIAFEKVSAPAAGSTAYKLGNPVGNG